MVTLNRCIAQSLAFVLLAAGACSTTEDDDAGGDAAGTTSAEDGTGGNATQGTPDDGADDGGGEGDTPNTMPSDEDTAGDADTASDDTAGPSDTGTAGDTASETTGVDATPPPTDAAELLTWLEAGTYLDWSGESGLHDSSGPHFGGVLTYVNPPLLDSLGSGGPMHPVNSAAVKELYGAGDTVDGWSVIVKVADGSGGDTWYFYEYYQGTTYGNAVGDGGCTGCHGTGSVDFFKSPFPLQ